MLKLLLTSTGFTNPKLGKVFLELVENEAAQIKVIFIPTAARTEEEWKYVMESKQELFDLGIKKENLKILDIDHKVKYDEVSDYHVMYVCGGNTFYLLAKVREHGFDHVIKRFVEEGNVYVGVSAGSVLVCPTIEIASPWDDNDVGLIDFTGVNLIDSVLSPHYKEEEKEMIDRLRSKLPYKIITLTDNQALRVKGNEIAIVE